MTMRKKSHLLLSHKRMNRYQLDVGLCKHKKIVGGDYSVFLAYEARNLNILGLNSRVEWEKLTSVCDYFHSPLCFLTPFVELKYGKRMIPVKLHELTTCEASDVITRFKSHVRGSRSGTFLCTSGTKSHSSSAKFKYTHIKQSSKWR